MTEHKPRRLSHARFAWWMSAQIALGARRHAGVVPPTYLEANPARAQLAEARWDTYWSGRVWWRCDHCGIRSDATVTRAALAASFHNLDRHPRRARRMMLEALAFRRVDVTY